MGNISGHRLGLAVASIFTLVGTALTPTSALSLECQKSPEVIYEDTKDKVVEIFSIAINPFKVHGRVLPRTGTGFLLIMDLSLRITM